jgi:hypothetical protein
MHVHILMVCQQMSACILMYTLTLMLYSMSFSTCHVSLVMIHAWHEERACSFLGSCTTRDMQVNESLCDRLIEHELLFFMLCMDHDKWHMTRVMSCVTSHMSERTSMFVPRFMHDTRHASEKSKIKAYVTGSLNMNCLFTSCMNHDKWHMTREKWHTM